MARPSGSSRVRQSPIHPIQGGPCPLHPTRGSRASADGDTARPAWPASRRSQSRPEPAPSRPPAPRSFLRESHLRRRELVRGDHPGGRGPRTSSSSSRCSRLLSAPMSSRPTAPGTRPSSGAASSSPRSRKRKAGLPGFAEHLTDEPRSDATTLEGRKEEDTVELHPAQRLWRRLGFVEIGPTETRLLMEHPAMDLS
jgi:hypothetical protein